jgi:CBS domain-containing protein
MTSLVPLGRAATRTGVAARDAAPGRPLPAAPLAVRRRRSAADVMDRHPATVSRSASLWQAWDRLRAGGRHVVVVDEHRRPAGVLDERTVALEWPPGPMGAHRTPVHTLLRGRVTPRVRGGDDLASVARVMLGAEADAVPVVDQDGRLYGLVTLWHYARLAADGGAERVEGGSTPAGRRSRVHR